MRLSREGRRRGALASGATLAAIAIAVLGPAGVARADVPVSQVGWWTRSPSPPAVPDGGIAVGAAPDGALTVGAVLLDAGEGASGAELRLVETDGTGPIATIQVCPTTSSWSAEAGGAMADAPEGQCDASAVAMTRGDDGTWAADVQPLLDGKTGDVGLLVTPTAESVAFHLSFAPPSVSGSVADDAATSAPTTSTTSAPATNPASSGSAASAPTPNFVAPPSPAPSEGSATAVTLATIPEGDPNSSANADAVAFTPQLGAAVPAGESSSDVGAGTVVLWYVLALAVGGAVAGLTWLRNAGRFSAATVLARVRR